MASDYSYIYDPEHKKNPGSGFSETEKGWSKTEYQEDIQKPEVQDKFVFEHNAVFKFGSKLNVNFHGTTEGSKSFPSRFRAALKRFTGKKNQYKEFQQKYSELLDSVVEKTQGSENPLVIYGWSVRKGQDDGQFDVEMLGVDPVHTAMIGEEIAKEFGRVEIATDTPTQETKSIIIDKNGNASSYQGLPAVHNGKTRFTFSTNVTVDIDNTEPKDFIDGLKKAFRNKLISMRNDIMTRNNERNFIKKVKTAFEDAGVNFTPQQMSISPVFGGYRDQKTHEVGTEISYDIHFKQIDPEQAVLISKALNKHFHQQSTLLTGYGKNKRAAFYISGT